MDVVALLKDAIGQLPQGDFTTGLSAILRHVQSAIRHYERDKLEDPDCCTDAIYRTNQAYEGSLKESYRVLAGKDPAKLTTYEIEQYLEQNNIVRPKIIIQLTRYRQDYRNPSTHDYKLDFDENEALLAIVSVAAFGKLLVDQMASKIFLNNAVEDIKINPVPGKKIRGTSPEQYLQSMTDSLCGFLNKVFNESNSERKETARLAAYLASQDVDVAVNSVIETDHRWDIEWDIVVSIDNIKSIGIDVKSARGRPSPTSTEDRIDKLVGLLNDSALPYGLLVEGAARGEKYMTERHERDNLIIYRIGKVPN